jgi:SWI/SNF-related matrix-associated actin-dependent regulator 1 of chromatin subfamily A
MDGNLFVAECPRDAREQFRRVGFRWHEQRGQLVTPSAQVAAQLRQYADDQAKKKILNAFIQVKPWLGRIPYPQGLEPLPFQPGAARFALERNRSYLALDPGLGKTIVASLVLNALGRHLVVFVVPPFLTLNTENELQKWLTWKTAIKIWGNEKSRYANLPLIHIVPDSLIADPLGDRQELYTFFERIPAWSGGATLIVDEAHRYKNNDAQRTHALHSISNLFNRVVLMSGTPMPNRPMELYGTLSHFAPETIDFKSHRQFGLRYCAGYFDGYGYNFDGASNIKELASKVRKVFMLRLRKKDVLRDLPPKSEELIFLAESAPPTVAAVEREMLAKHSPTDLMQGKLGVEHMSTYRHKLGLAKAPLAVAFLKDLLSESSEAVLVFAEHTEVIERLTKGLAKFHPIVITGKVNKNHRQALVEEFQKNPKRRVFIGNIKACGVGFTITKATRVVFAEFSWVPGDNDQASDRTHRIGQKDNVLVQYLVFKNSIDRAVMETNLRKRKTTNAL